MLRSNSRATDGDGVRLEQVKGAEGLLLRRKNVDRLVLRVQILAQAVSTEIDARLLEIIDWHARG